MTEKLSEDIVEHTAFLFYERLKKQDEKNGVKWLRWDQHLDGWKDYYKHRILNQIKDLDFTVVNQWIDRGTSPYVIARFIVLLYDIDQYAKKQKERIDSISDPVMKQGVIDSLRNKYD